MKNGKMMKILSLSLALVLLFCQSAFAVEYPAEGTANSSGVRVRKKTSTSSDKVVELKKGETVTVLEDVTVKSGDLWYKVETAKGKTGYILSDYLSVAETDLIEAAENSAEAVLMKLKVIASCSDYNSVGSKWTQFYEMNGVHVENDTMTVYVAPGIDFSVYARIREQDSNPDTGTEKTVYTPTADEVLNGFTVAQTVRVTENGGRYAGNTAVWTVKFVFTPEE